MADKAELHLRDVDPDATVFAVFAPLMRMPGTDETYVCSARACRASYVFERKSRGRHGWGMMRAVMALGVSDARHGGTRKITPDNRCRALGRQAAADGGATIEFGGSTWSTRDGAVIATFEMLVFGGAAAAARGKNIVAAQCAATRAGATLAEAVVAAARDASDRVSELCDTRVDGVALLCDWSITTPSDSEIIPALRAWRVAHEIT